MLVCRFRESRYRLNSSGNNCGQPSSRNECCGHGMPLTSASGSFNVASSTVAIMIAKRFVVLVIS
jgi:hypothetical protein